MKYEKCCRNCEYAYLSPRECKGCETFGNNKWENFKLRNELAKIENGTLIEFKYVKGDTVYLISYMSGKTKVCECCGQEYQSAFLPHRVIKGIISARRYIEPDESVREEGGIFYRIFTGSQGELSWYGDRNENDLFATEQEAEAKLAELKGEGK